MSMPDSRGWVVVGIFALAFAQLGMIGLMPGLAENKLFFAITTATWTSGVLLITGFYFGSSKSSTSKDETIATMAASASATPDPKDPS